MGHNECPLRRPAVSILMVNVLPFNVKIFLLCCGPGCTIFKTLLSTVGVMRVEDVDHASEWVDRREEWKKNVNACITHIISGLSHSCHRHASCISRRFLVPSSTVAVTPSATFSSSDRTSSSKDKNGKGRRLRQQKHFSQRFPKDFVKFCAFAVVIQSHYVRSSRTRRHII